jgi:hypothetical protein
MISTGTMVRLNNLGVDFIKESYEDFEYNNELYEVVTIDEEDDLFEINVNNHYFWLKQEEIEIS